MKKCSPSTRVGSDVPAAHSLAQHGTEQEGTYSQAVENSLAAKPAAAQWSLEFPTNDLPWLKQNPP